MTHCECIKELTSQSADSPGLVQDDEPIVFALVNPLTGSFKDISKSQLQTSTLSVCRAAHISGAEAKSKTVDELIAKDETRKHEGFLWAECSEIRALQLGSTNARAFCVIDDALPGYAAHAHLGFSEPSDPLWKNHRVTARGNLMLTFKKRGVFTDWNAHPFANNDNPTNYVPPGR